MKKLLAKIQKILRDRRTRQFLTRFVSVTAAIVVFVTTYALVLPAITMEREKPTAVSRRISMMTAAMRKCLSAVWRNPTTISIRLIVMRKN